MEGTNHEKTNVGSGFGRKSLVLEDGGTPQQGVKVPLRSS
jgi:hypothetical protein